MVIPTAYVNEAPEICPGCYVQGIRWYNKCGMSNGVCPRENLQEIFSEDMFSELVGMSKVVCPMQYVQGRISIGYDQDLCSEY